MKVKVAQSCPTLCDPMDYTVHGILQARILDWAAFHFSRGSSQLRDRRFPTLQADSLLYEPPGKPKNTGVGSLSCLQWIFLTQELNQGLLHCRWILYQLAMREACILTCVWLFATLWTVPHQALSMGFFRQEYWSRLPFPPPEIFLTEPMSPVFPAL